MNKNKQRSSKQIKSMDNMEKQINLNDDIHENDKSKKQMKKDHKSIEKIYNYVCVYIYIYEAPSKYIIIV